MAEDSPPDSPEKPPEKAPGKPRRRHRTTQPQLLTRAELDGRTNAARTFDRLVRAIEVDLGGRDQLSTIELALIEAFAGAAVTMQNINARLVLGHTPDLIQHAQAASVMVRIATRLGLQRRAREVLDEDLLPEPDPQQAELAAQRDAQWEAWEQKQRAKAQNQEDVP